MKKSVVFLLTVVLCFSTFLCAYSAGATASVNAKFDSEIDAIVVSGNVLTEKGNIKLALKITNPAGNVVYTDQITIPYNEEANNNYVYTFDPIVLDYSCLSGKYTVTVSGKWLSADASVLYDYVGLDKSYNALSALISAVSSQNTTKLVEAVKTYGNDLGVDSLLLTELDDDGELAFATEMLTKKYQCPEGYTSDADALALNEQIKKFRADYKKAVLTGQYNDLSSGTEVGEWIAVNAAMFKTDIPETAENEEELFSYVQRVKGESGFVSRTLSHKIISDIDAVRAQLYADAMLTIIESHHYSEIRSILEKYPEKFGIDTAKLKKLNDTQNAKAYEEVKGKYDSLSDVGTAFNKIISNMKASSSSSGGSSSSSGGSSSSVKAPLKQAVPTAEKKDLIIFNDIVSVPWAEEAINFLAKKGIVNGKSEGIFDPDAYITRSEFIKMLVASTNISLTLDSSSFTDVYSTDWYAPYVVTAEKNGLIKGDENNKFNPYDYITRQDMATIIYRYLGLEGYTNGTLTFADADNISDYAKAAVACLASEKILNGMGNNMFMPKENATRAQSAVMLYNMIK